MGPNIKGMVKKHAHILNNCQIMQNNIRLILLMKKCTRMFHAINNAIHVRILWSQKCDLVALLSTLLMFVVTQMIPQKFLDLLLLIN